MNTRDVTPRLAYHTTAREPVPVLLLNLDAPSEQRTALAVWLLQILHSTAETASTSAACEVELKDVLANMLPALEIAMSLVEVAA